MLFLQEQFFIYALNLLLILSIYKGYKHGARYELILIFFFLISCFVALIFYNHSIAKKILSILMFSITYFLGLFIAFLNKKNSDIENKIGAIIGFFNFFIYLISLTVIANLLNAKPISYSENFYVKKINPIAKKITKIIEKNINENDK